MKETLKLTWKLFLICAVAAILLGFTNMVTAEPIAEQKEKKATLARQSVMDAEMFEELDISQAASGADYKNVMSAFAAYDGQGNAVGAVIGVSATGFNSGMELTVGIDKAGVITGVYIGAHNETAGIGTKAMEPSLLSQFAGVAADGSLSVDTNVAAISGATKSSKGVVNGINLASVFYGDVVAGMLEEVQ